MNFSAKYLKECISICKQINPDKIEKMAELVNSVRENKGRIFFLGVGGGAGHAGHAVNDFRKICSIESYAPTDNVSELTARVNDDGWDTSYVNWLKGSHLNSKDMLFVFSVGGGNLEKNISVIAFEPMKKTFSELKKIEKENKGKFKCFNIALSNKIGVTEMYFTGPTSQLSSIAVNLKKLNFLKNKKIKKKK